VRKQSCVRGSIRGAPARAARVGRPRPRAEGTRNVTSSRQTNTVGVSGQQRNQAGRALALLQAALGLILCGAGGAALALGPLHPRSQMWWALAGAAALAGLCLVLTHRRSPRPALTSAGAASAPDPPRQPDVLVPMLGALLAFKFRFINEWQLQKALDLQRRDRKHQRRLGSILIDLGFITRAQLDQALQAQRTYARLKRDRLRPASRSAAPAMPTAGAATPAAAAPPPSLTQQADLAGPDPSPEDDDITILAH